MKSPTLIYATLPPLGMSQIGGTRGIADTRMTSASQKSQGVLGLQTGWNKGASQKGMSFGGIRHICDTKVGREKDKEGKPNDADTN